MIRFMRYNIVYFIISALVLIPGMFYLLRYGLKPSIDFTGGTLLELTIETKTATPSAVLNDISTDSLKKIATPLQIELNTVQSSGKGVYLLKMKTIDQAAKKKLEDAIASESAKVSEVRFETVGPLLGKELLEKTLVASLFAVIVILGYVAWAFKNIRFGISAVIALIHDVLTVIGVFAILGKIHGVEVDVLFVTALLTTMSFSVHDTIVVFDRVREMLKKGHGGTFEQLVDQALTETIGRSLNNSLTIVFMLLALFLLGGETIRWFVFALLVGTISGAYSSPFVATPILYLWHKVRDKEK